MASCVRVTEPQSEQILHEEDVRLLMTLMQSFSDRWRDIGMELGFTQPELNQIGKNPMLLTTAPKSFMTELLSQWVQWPTKDHPKVPTLGALCDTLRSSLVRLGSLAETVEGEMKCSTTGTGQKHCRSSTSEVYKPTLSPDVKEDLRQRIHCDTKQMRDKFSTLQTMIRNNIKKTIDHKDLAAHVSGMYILTEEHESQVANTSTIDDIFMILTKYRYWSFLDFSNLENIAKTFCRDYNAEKELLKQYNDDVRRFCERRVSELPPGSLNNGTDIEGMDKLVVTLDLQDPLLSNVLHLKEVIATILGLPASKLVLHDIGTGSIVVTFLVATSLGEKLFITKTLTQKQRDQLLEANVVSLKFKEMIISIHQNVKKGPPQIMASTPSPEVKSIMIQTPDLTTALANEPLDVAGILLSKGFISGEIMSKMPVVSYTPTEKATILIEAVRNKVELAPSKFTEFLEILSEVACAKEVVESLRSTYQRVQQADSVVSKIERLKNQFDQLHDQLMAELKIHSISMNMLLDALTLLPLSLRREYDVRGLCTLTSKGITTDELFIVHLNPLMNFIDYGLLAHLIRNFGSGSLKEDMHTYESNVQLFMKQTTISEIVGPGVDHLPNQQDTPPKFTKLMTKITLEGAQHITLEQLDALRLKFCAHLKLSEVVFRLKRVEIG